MADIHVPAPILGIDVQNPVNLIDDRAAADGTQNVDFENGTVKTPNGFKKLSCSSPLVSGKRIFGLTQYSEVGGRMNIVAATDTKLFMHDIVNDTWTEITGDTIDANQFYPVSFAGILHQDAVGGKYQHLIISDGGRSEILRWYGNGGSLAELAGGGGYNSGAEASHKAMQVCSYQNRLLLISPYEYDGSIWQPNLSRVRWPLLGKLETWTGDGSGFTDLIDTGDINVWASLLGSTLIVYQKHSIWQLRYVGGTTVFVPDILVPDLGLLSSGLHCTTGSTHYFVGNDFNIYSYSGGTMLKNIGGPIADLFKRDLDVTKIQNCRMAVGAEHKYLWIFIVTDGDYATKAYKFNLRTEAWTVRDFGNKYSGSGITASALIMAATYLVGDTYDDAVAAGDTYYDTLIGSETTKTETPTATTWNAAGKVMTGTGSTWKSTNKVNPGDFVKVISGTNATAGYYRVLSVTSDTVMTLSDSIGANPLNVDYDIFAASGDTYVGLLTEIRVEEKLTLGDSDGYILQEDTELNTDDGIEPTRYFYSKEFDGGIPDMSKRVDGVYVDAMGDYVTIEYSIDGGEWTAI